MTTNNWIDTEDRRQASDMVQLDSGLTMPKPATNLQREISVPKPQQQSPTQTNQSSTGNKQTKR